MEIALTHQRLFFSELDELLCNRNLLIVLALFDISPRHTSAAVRVKTALHANLRTIVDAGAARHGKQQRKEAVVHIKPACHISEADCVMGVQHIK